MHKNNFSVPLRQLKDLQVSWFKVNSPVCFKGHIKPPNRVLFPCTPAHLPGCGAFDGHGVSLRMACWQKSTPFPLGQTAKPPCSLPLAACQWPPSMLLLGAAACRDPNHLFCPRAVPRCYNCTATIQVPCHCCVLCWLCSNFCRRCCMFLPSLPAPGVSWPWLVPARSQMPLPLTDR